MIRNRLSGWVALVLGAAALSSTAEAGLGSSTVIVMPARPRLVQLAFEIAAIKDVGLVSYNNSPTLVTPLVHAWNGSKWVQISMDEYVSGAFLPSKVKHAFILGDSVSLPAAMAADPAWAGEVHKTADFDTATLINQFGAVLKFSSPEWRWLAEQNGLTLTDHNAERRRYGRWGKDNVDESVVPARSTPGTLPPEPPVTGIKEPTTLTIPAAPAAAAVPAPAAEPAQGPTTITTPVLAPEVKPAEKAPETPKAVEAPKAEAPAAPAAKPEAPAAPAATNAPAPAAEAAIK